MMTDIQPLILGVEKPIYLAATGPLEESSSEIIGWTTIKPQYDNGSIDKGSVLLFINISSEEDVRGFQPLEFMIMHIGPIPGEYPADFLQEEIDTLTKEGALTLLELKNVDEISIAIGEVFIKYSDYISGIKLSYDAKVFSPKDLYITMGPNEMRKSDAKITTGEKISLNHIIDVYSSAVGKNLISK